MKMIRFVMYWALAGLFIPVVILIISQYLWDIFEWPYLVVALWPSSIQLMAIHEPDVTFTVIVLGISIGINVLLYSVVGAVLWLLGSLFGRFLK